MKIVPLRRAPRAALTFIAIVALPFQAGAQQIISATTPITPANTNSFEFQGGTLQDVSGGTSSSPSAYANSVTIDPNQTGTIDANGSASNWSGLFSGTGNLLTLTDSVGGGMITLSNGANSYTGVTAINGVTVGFANQSVFGTGSLSLTGGTLINVGGGANVANNIQLNAASAANIFDAHGNSTAFSGTIFGSGGVTLKNGGATVAQIDLTGTNYFTGAVTVLTNRLTLGVANSGFGTGPISFDGSTTLQTVGAASLTNTVALGPMGSVLTLDADGHNSTLSGAISGAGAMTFIDSTGSNGVVTISGAGSGWTGGTNIGDGTHMITVALGGANALSPNGALTVNANGVFDMKGFAQQLNAPVIDDGTIKTGAGTLTVTGANYAAGAGSFLGLFPSFTSPNLSVSGTASLTGETLFIEARPASGKYTIVTAGSGLGGTIFDSASCPAGTAAAVGFCLPTGYTGSLSYLTPNDVILSLTAPTLIFAGQSRNQVAVAGALNATNASNSADMSAVLAQINTLAVTSRVQLNETLDELNPIHYAALSALSQAGAGAQMEAVNRRVSSLQAGLSARGDQVAYDGMGARAPYPGTLVAEGGGGPVPPAAPVVNPLDNPWGIFASGLYATGRLDGINGSAGYQPGYGFNSYGGMMGADYRFSDEFAAGLTAGYVSGLADFDGIGGQASNKSLLFGAYAATWSGAFHGSLYVGTSLDSFSTSRNIPDFGRTATASPNGNEFKLDASGAWDIKEGRALLTPYADLTYNHQHVDAFSEGGAGALDLNVGPMGTNSLRSAFGAKFSRKFTLDWFSITPSLNAGWEHEFADQSRAIDAQFSTGGGSFSTDTADVARDALAAGAALTMDMGENVSLRLGYSGDFRSDFSARTADFSLRVRF